MVYLIDFHGALILRIDLILKWISVLPYNSSYPQQETAALIFYQVTKKKWGLATSKQFTALLSQESAFNPIAYNQRSGTMGIGQISPEYLPYFQKMIKSRANPMTLIGGLELSGYVFGQCAKYHKSKEKRWACYHSGLKSHCTLKYPHKNCPETNRHVLKVSDKYYKLNN